MGQCDTIIMGLTFFRSQVVIGLRLLGRRLLRLLSMVFLDTKGRILGSHLLDLWSQHFWFLKFFQSCQI